MNLGTHEAMFRWVLKRLAAEGLLSGKNLGVDATTLEANAALKSIVRRDNGAGYDEHVTALVKTEGLEEPTPAQPPRFDPPIHAYFSAAGFELIFWKREPTGCSLRAKSVR